MMATNVEVLVIGAGCAGLSLAKELAASAYPGDVLLIDQRSGHERDRTWCFFDRQQAYANVAVKRWDRFAMSVPGEGEEIFHTSFPYVCVPSHRWNDHCLASIAEVPNITVQLGVSVESIERTGDSFRVTAQDRVIVARYVVDTRPPALSPTGLKQHFVGWEIRSDEAAFDEERATLMDFRRPERPGVHFLYVLPFSTHEALVETTWFGHELHAPQAYEAEIRRELERLGVRRYEITFREQGVLPMEVITPPNDGIIRLGTAGGAMRASTGYAFLPTQRQARQAANWLLSRHVQRPSTLPAPLFPVRSAVLTNLDRIFLRFVSDRPSDVPATLVGLFRKATPHVAIRFLQDWPSGMDLLRILWAMPKLAMTQALLRLFFSPRRTALPAPSAALERPQAHVPQS